MSTPINTNTITKLLWPGLNKIWGESYPDYKTEWSEIFTKYTSNRNWEEDLGMSGFGLLSVKNEGSPITYDTMKQGFTTRYIHAVVGGGFMITREAVEDNLYAIEANKKARALAKAEQQTRETFGANVLNRSVTAGYVGGDGVTLLSTAHPNVAGGTFSNRLATDANISEAVLEDMSINVWAFLDDRGLKAALKPRKIIVPPALAFETDRILKTDGRVGTDLNDRNTLKAMGTFPEGYFVSHYLTSTTAFYVLTNADDGLKYFERRAAEFKADNDFDTENAKFKVTARYVFGWTDPRCIYGTIGV